MPAGAKLQNHQKKQKTEGCQFEIQTLVAIHSLPMVAVPNSFVPNKFLRTGTAGTF